MYDCRRFYIDGRWLEPDDAEPFPVIDPATEMPIGEISLGNARHVDAAVAAARQAFSGWADSPIADRRALFGRFIEIYRRRYEEMARAISDEMGAPIGLARGSQARLGIGHMQTAMELLERFAFEEELDGNCLRYEPIGVCGLITPWNWPVNQIACKVAPALAAGCTMVLKPSEIAPLSGYLFAEILDEAGVPPGVFNLVNGDGPGVGAPMAAHPDVDMVSFTGSTRAGIAVAKAAADTVKRVSQELGGKSPNIILDDEVLPRAVEHGMAELLCNSGQSCNAPTRMLVPRAMQQQVAALARAAAEAAVVGDPKDERTTMGPVVSQAQFDKIQALIQAGIDEGATLICGGPGKPEGLERGYYLRPTVFADVRNDMRIAREEIFGPVLAIIPFDSEAEAIEIANDTPYGLAAYVSGSDPAQVRRVAERLRAGMIHCNGAEMTLTAPFGGYKQSGNGREWGRAGLEEFLERKIILGR
ncbi:MAG: aldehyde dehydrogenase family protein [Gammaproteobacteria bacterium]|nr:MAG: aldehyde dehydrogenase family protein [Gammaproteobacteria bacterium]